MALIESSLKVSAVAQLDACMSLAGVKPFPHRNMLQCI